MDIVTSQELSPRLRRMLELVYGVEGVTAARVWHWPGRVAVGVRPAMLSAPAELLRRVESAVAGLREPDETWEFGLLDTDDPPSSSSPSSAPST
jgi:hypothetical protein